MKHYEAHVAMCSVWGELFRAYTILRAHEDTQKEADTAHDISLAFFKVCCEIYELHELTEVGV